MISVQRILPYTKQLVLYALYGKKANTTKRKTAASPPK